MHTLKTEDIQIRVPKGSFIFEKKKKNLSYVVTPPDPILFCLNLHLPTPGIDTKFPQWIPNWA
jgi:hypothetical protein